MPSWSFRFLLSAGAFTFILCLTRGDDTETVKEKLYQAKKAYDGEVRKFRKAIGDWYDKRETDARKAGNKKQLDRVKAERKQYEETGEVAVELPTAVRKQIVGARSSLDKAYQLAVADYLRRKEDNAADAIEKERQKFHLDFALQYGNRTYLVTLRHSDVRAWNNWFSNNGTQADKPDVKYKLNGELVPHSINVIPTHRGTAQVKYMLGEKWTAFRATVGVPKIEDNGRDPASALTFEVIGDSKSLWKSEPVTKMNEFQQCTVNIEKVKALTLLIHCADRAEWARSVWFEPMLYE